MSKRKPVRGIDHLGITVPELDARVKGRQVRK